MVGRETLDPDAPTMHRLLLALALLALSPLLGCPQTTPADDDDDSTPIVDDDDDDSTGDDDDSTGDDDDSTPADADGDGYDESVDCDDTDPAVHPDAEEVCNDIDDDCDGALGADELDGDGDGRTACTGDCDDEDAAIHTGASELCDGVDNDCDGREDEGAEDAATWYQDADRDGIGAEAVSRQACDTPEGYVEEAGDCDDRDEDSYPGADELCDGADNDCDGAVDEDDAVDGATWYRDGDRDGWGTDDVTQTACAMPEGYVAEGGDCDDRTPRAYPGAVEVCDPHDNDCDGETNEDAEDARTWYRDVDRDRYGLDDETVTGCRAPARLRP